VDLSTLYAAAARLNRLAGQFEMASTLEMRRRELWQHWNSRLPANVFIEQQIRSSDLVNGNHLSS
jgi:hypothetical protein